MYIHTHPYAHTHIYNTYTHTQLAAPKQSLAYSRSSLNIHSCLEKLNVIPEYFGLGILTVKMEKKEIAQG